MSTKYGLGCVSHNPPIVSPTWFTRPGEARVLLQQRDSGHKFDDDEIYRYDVEWPPPAKWLSLHPHCFVRVFNEYDEFADHHGEAYSPVSPPARYL